AELLPPSDLESGRTGEVCRTTLTFQEMPDRKGDTYPQPRRKSVPESETSRILCRARPEVRTTARHLHRRDSRRAADLPHTSRSRGGRRVERSPRKPFWRTRRAALVRCMLPLTC